MSERVGGRQRLVQGEFGLREVDHRIATSARPHSQCRIVDRGALVRLGQGDVAGACHGQRLHAGVGKRAGQGGRARTGREPAAIPAWVIQAERWAAGRHRILKEGEAAVKPAPSGGPCTELGRSRWQCQRPATAPLRMPTRQHAWRRRSLCRWPGWPRRLRFAQGGSNGSCQPLARGARGQRRRGWGGCAQGTYNASPVALTADAFVDAVAAAGSQLQRSATSTQNATALQWPCVVVRPIPLLGITLGASTTCSTIKIELGCGEGAGPNGPIGVQPAVKKCLVSSTLSAGLDARHDLRDPAITGSPHRFSC